MTQPDDADAGSVHLDIEADIARMTFDRPSARNAMTWSMYQQLNAHCGQLAQRHDIRVVILTGAGDKAFVAGTDIAQFLAFQDAEDGVRYEATIDATIGRLSSLPQITIARLRGWTVGGGLAMATSCDFRVADASAKFAVPIARTVGNTLSAANLAMLTAAWGQQPVRRMLLAAETLDATTALQAGYLHQIADAAALDATVHALADQVRVLAPVTQRSIKEGLRRLVSQSVPAMEDLIRACYGSRDFREGIRAFTEKRAPDWRGA